MFEGKTFKNLTMDDIKDAFINQKTIVGACERFSNGTFKVRLGDEIYADLEIQEASIYNYQMQDEHLPLFVYNKLFSKTINVKVISLDPLMISRKKSMEEELCTISEALLSETPLNVKITNIDDEIGLAFCDLGGGVEGSLHIADLALTHVFSICELVAVNDIVPCLVKKSRCLEEDNKFSLSYREIFKQKEYNIGDIVIGKVRKNCAYNGRKFVELSPNQTGRFEGSQGEYGKYAIFKVRENFPCSKSSLIPLIFLRGIDEMDDSMLHVIDPSLKV